MAGLFSGEAMDSDGSLANFFLKGDCPLVAFPLRYEVSWLELTFNIVMVVASVNSGANLSVRSYHRIASGRICRGCETV